MTFHLEGKMHTHDAVLRSLFDDMMLGTPIAVLINHTKQMTQIL